jgi:hypothetical protein
VAIRLVGAVDVEVQFARGVEVEHLETGGSQTRRRALGTGDCAPNAQLLRSHRIDKVIDRGARTDAEDGVLDDVGEGGEGGLLLQLIRVHGGNSMWLDAAKDLFYACFPDSGYDCARFRGHSLNQHQLRRLLLLFGSLLLAAFLLR